MAIERRRHRPKKPPKQHHPRKHKPKKHPKKKKQTAAASGTADQSAVVSTPDNTGTGNDMDSDDATPATLQGQGPDAQQNLAGYFSTGPGQADHYHPQATFVDMVAQYTDETTTTAGSTNSLNNPPAASENPT